MVICIEGHYLNNMIRNTSNQTQVLLQEGFIAGGERMRINVENVTVQGFQVHY